MSDNPFWKIQKQREEQEAEIKRSQEIREQKEREERMRREAEERQKWAKEEQIERRITESYNRLSPMVMSVLEKYRQAAYPDCEIYEPTKLSRLLPLDWYRVWKWRIVRRSYGMYTVMRSPDFGVPEIPVTEEGWIIDDIVRVELHFNEGYPQKFVVKHFRAQRKEKKHWLTRRVLDWEWEDAIAECEISEQGLINALHQTHPKD
jgi:hypothetical protein